MATPAATPAPPPSPKLVAPGEGKSVKLFGVRFSYKVERADSGGSLAILEVVIPSGTLVKPHTHTREDEFSLVLAGTVGVRVGDQVLQAGQGAYLVKPRGVPHAMWNTGGGPATVIEILSPGGLETYFEELAPILAHEGGAGPQEYYDLAERYGITIRDDWIKELQETYSVKL
jgi:quercetin dioxygenase-like cupin family protein